MTTYKCDNCEFSTEDDTTFNNLHQIANLAERLTPGGIVPDGECPKCGAFVYSITEEPRPLSGWRKEFPGFDNDIDALAKRLKDEFGFYDSSWHNDACPSFSAIDDSLRIWVNWQNPDLREGWDNLYGIDLPGEEDSVNDTDDLEEAIAVIKALIAEKSERKVNPALEALRYHITGAIERGEGVAITEQRADAKITELIRDVKDGDCALSAIFDDGSTRKLFNFYIDELAFFDADLLGKTQDEAHQLHHQRTVAFLQS